MLKFTPIRINILVIAFLIAAVCFGILVTIVMTVRAGGEGNQFIIGALIGLLGSGITGLAGLGTTLLTEG